MEKVAFRKISGAMLTVGVFWFVISYLPRFLWNFTFDDYIPNSTLSSIVSFIFSIIMYSLAILIFYFFLRKLPKISGEPKKKMKVFEFLGWACSMRGVAMLLSLIGVLLFILLVIIVHGPSAIMEMLTKSNPLLVFGSADMITNLILISIVAPIMEEIMFRRLFLDVLRPFGDLISILYSGIMFGLLHMNIQQITYACGLGIMLGYVMVKTNNLICCIALHASLNATTAILLPFMEDIADINDLSRLIPFISIIGALVFISVVGLVLFFVYLKRVNLEKARFRFLVPINAKLVLFNIGTIPYTLLCLAVSVLVIIEL